MKNKLLTILRLLLLATMFALPAYADVSLVNQYDPNGNLISGDGKFYEYNDANKLVRVRENDRNGKVIAEYFYDFAGQRVKKIESGVTTYYVGNYYETNVVAGKADNSSYFFANGERVAKKDSTGTYFYHPDHLGGVNAVTSAAGAVVAKTSYLPFGEVRQGGQEKFSYTGKEKDKATDLYYFDARFNSAELRHFTQADSADPDLSDPQDLNRYAYVGNNPLSYVDPDGHKKKHHSKKEEKALAKARAAENARKKANKKSEEKQRAASDYAKHNPASASGGRIGVGDSLPVGGDYQELGFCVEQSRGLNSLSSLFNSRNGIGASSLSYTKEKASSFGQHGWSRAFYGVIGLVGGELGAIASGVYMVGTFDATKAGFFALSQGAAIYSFGEISAGASEGTVELLSGRDVNIKNDLEILNPIDEISTALTLGGGLGL